MKSRTLAKALMACSIATLATAAYAETLIVTTNVPPVHWASTKGGEPYMACVKQATNNDINFNYFPGGQIAGFNETLNAVNNGLAQISYIVVSAQTDKLALTGITMLPGLGDTVVDMTKATRKVLDDPNSAIAKEYAQNRIVPLVINIFPAYQMLSRGGPLDSLQTIKGKKISSGGGTLNVILAGVGASSIEMPAGDIYLAMKQGTIDGTMLSLASVQPYKLQEVVKSMSANANFGTAAGIWSIDSAVWAKLSPANKKAMMDCGLKVEMELAAYVDGWVKDLATEFKGQGINVYNFSKEALAEIDTKIEAARQDYIKRVAARGMPAQKAYEEYVAALKK